MRKQIVIIYVWFLQKVNNKFHNTLNVMKWKKKKNNWKIPKDLQNYWIFIGSIAELSFSR